jgi:Flp pilus assembly protein TadB
MAGVINNTIGLYQELTTFFPSYVVSFFNFAVLVLIIVAYAFMVWKGYRFLSKKNFLGLNLDKYNRSSNPILTKLIAGTFFFLEYLIMSPIIIFIAFGVFTFFLIILTQGGTTAQILLISAAIIAAVRMTSYSSETLSRELAKFLPLTILSIAILNPTTFVEGAYIEKILTHMREIPEFLRQIGYYLVYILIIELILRFFDFTISIFSLEDRQ